MNVCFWFIPPSLRGKEGTEDYQEKLAKVDMLCPSTAHTHTYLDVACTLLVVCILVKKNKEHTILCILLLIVCILFLLKGGSGHQRTHDEARHYDGWLPASRKQGQLFSCDCVVATTVPERHGLPPQWNWKTRKGSVTKLTCEHLLWNVMLCV